jgi:CBS domain-containing protein
MNILFFLTPKSEVDYLYDDYTMRQAIEKMDYHGYSAVPVINREGHYISVLTEGDLLRELKRRYQLDLTEAENIPISAIPRSRDIQSVHASARMEDLVERAASQNFIPVVDDQEKFIGIITRRDIILYCYQAIKKQAVV